METQANYDPWQFGKAAERLQQLRSGRVSCLDEGEKAANSPSKGRAGTLKRDGASQPTLPLRLAVSPLMQISPNLKKQALISTGGKQPKVTATGESGLPDQIKEKPWSEYGSAACPDPRPQHWRQRPMQPCLHSTNGRREHPGHPLPIALLVYPFTSGAPNTRIRLG